MALLGMDGTAVAMASGLVSTFPTTGVCLVLRPESHQHRKLFQVTECRGHDIMTYAVPAKQDSDYFLFSINCLATLFS